MHTAWKGPEMVFSNTKKKWPVIVPRTATRASCKKKIDPCIIPPYLASYLKSGLQKVVYIGNLEIVYRPQLPQFTYFSGGLQMLEHPVYPSMFPISVIETSKLEGIVLRYLTDSGIPGQATSPSPC